MLLGAKRSQGNFGGSTFALNHIYVKAKFKLIIDLIGFGNLLH